MVSATHVRGRGLEALGNLLTFCQILPGKKARSVRLNGL